ncbi:hypothetical protein H6503_02530 [Candidatus Woesearchaeota archaeon]|nr:hypothetical protein [Candidatus Woesearchaeota archaeon]
MKQKVLVTLIDSGWVDQAKQLFSSVFFNSGWEGDFLLMHNGIQTNDAKWFKEKGILLKKINICTNKKINQWHHIVLGKFFLFNEFFKRWKHVIYLDADIIIQSSLDNLEMYDGLAASYDLHTKVSWQFIKNSKTINLFKELEKEYDLSKPSFNCGVLSYPTHIIEQNTYNDLLKLFNTYSKIVRNPEQAILNVYFNNSWSRLPNCYNYFIFGSILGGLSCKLYAHRLPGAPVLHFIGKKKPWLYTNIIYTIWKKNLIKSEQIDLEKRVRGKKVNVLRLFLMSMSSYSMNYVYMIYVYRIIRIESLGMLGSYLNKKFKFIYKVLKFLKRD